MDKIRILRSGHLRFNTARAVEKEKTVTLAPMTTSEGVLSTSQPKWVPFVVLDVGQKNDTMSVRNMHQPEVILPLSTDSSVKNTTSLITSTHIVPADSKSRETANSSSRPRRRSASPRKKQETQDAKVITEARKSSKKSKSRTKKTASPAAKRNTVPTDNCAEKKNGNTLSKDSIISNPNKEISTSIAESQQDAVFSIRVPMYPNNSNATITTLGPSLAFKNTLVFTNPSPQVYSSMTPEPSPVVTVSLAGNKCTINSDVKQNEEPNPSTSTSREVHCVICSLPFSSLEEMRSHYISEHKFRRNRDSKKHKLDSLTTGPPKLPKLTLIMPKSKQREECTAISPDVNIYVDKSDPKCPVCSISFKTIQEVKDHVQMVHSYKCSECNGTFYTLFEFTCHKCNKGGKKVKIARKKLSQENSLKIPKGATNCNKIHKITLLKDQSGLVDRRQDTLENQVSSKPEIMPTLTREKAGIVQESSHLMPPLLSRMEEPHPLPVSVVNLSSQASGAMQGEEMITCVEENDLIAKHKGSLLGPASPVTNSKDTSANIRVLETKNLRGYRFKKEEVSETLETVEDKIAQLKKNPQVSVSWVPKLKGKKYENCDFVCGRCNVLCIDMEDYMEHIQDCLTITSVTLEPTSKPQRILKLQNERSSFGFQETNNNKYSLNKNLMNKLQSVFPGLNLSDTGSESQTPEERKNALSSELPDELCQCHQKNFLDRNSARVSDDISNEKSNVKLSVLNIKEEPIDACTPDHELSNHYPTSDLQRGLNKDSVPVVTPNKQKQPMVMIPVASKSEETLADLAGEHNNNSSSYKIANVKSISPIHDSSPNSTSWESSSLDLLIDTDDIKMEIEEEVIEDNFEGVYLWSRLYQQNNNYLLTMAKGIIIGLGQTRTNYCCFVSRDEIGNMEIPVHYFKMHLYSANVMVSNMLKYTFTYRIASLFFHQIHLTVEF
ncbi:hypothetical protein SK128_016900 [Halocaridina rubra]|uniref:C2H2-type domain-containing protein n=1 Tax=Halocaridina rubra TaxID=373956 RepID=A0AAN8XEB7_HALRR